MAIDFGARTSKGSSTTEEYQEERGQVILSYNGAESKVPFFGQVLIMDGTWYTMRLWATGGKAADGGPTKVEYSGQLKFPHNDGKDGPVIGYINVMSNPRFGGKERTYWGTMWVSWNRKVVDESWGYPKDLICFMYSNGGEKPILMGKLVDQREQEDRQQSAPTPGRNAKFKTGGGPRSSKLEI